MTNDPAMIGMVVNKALWEFEQMFMHHQFIGSYLKEICIKSPILRLNENERPKISKFDDLTFLLNGTFTI